MNGGHMLTAIGDVWAHFEEDDGTKRSMRVIAFDDKGVAHVLGTQRLVSVFSVELRLRFTGLAGHPLPPWQ